MVPGTKSPLMHGIFMVQQICAGKEVDETPVLCHYHCYNIYTKLTEKILLLPPMLNFMGDKKCLKM